MGLSRVVMVSQGPLALCEIRHADKQLYISGSFEDGDKRQAFKDILKINRVNNTKVWLRFADPVENVITSGYFDLMDFRDIDETEFSGILVREDNLTINELKVIND